MEMEALEQGKVLYSARNPERDHSVRKLFREMPSSGFELHFEEPRRILEQKNWQAESFDLCILDADDIVEWRDVLKKIRESRSTMAVVLLSNADDPFFEREALRLGAADVAVGSRLTPSALDRIIRHARYRSQVSKEMKERDADLLIQERLAAVGMLASGMAHEIGTPLGVIRGRSEVLLMRNHLNESMQRDLKIIIEQVDRIARLMRSLLNLARGDDMRSSLSMDLGRVVQDVVDVMGQVLRLEGIELILEIPSEVRFKVFAESEPFHQILLNLIQNSLHAIDTARAGGRGKGHWIRISIREAGADWVLAVEDSGCGMGPDVIQNLFRPFFTTKDIGKGVGLGLSLSYRILESWKGGISVESTPGVGSVFRITLPKAL